MALSATISGLVKQVHITDRAQITVCGSGEHGGRTIEDTDRHCGGYDDCHSPHPEQVTARVRVQRELGRGAAENLPTPGRVRNGHLGAIAGPARFLPE